MKGERVRHFFNSEAKALLALYKNIETLIPAQKMRGSSHVAEEGRYIESIVRGFLNKHLPSDLKAFSGFILRPAVKVGKHDRSRRINEVDQHSNQLDIIVYDHKNYPVYESFEEFVIVPPEGVISIISVKKNLYISQVRGELTALLNAARLCITKSNSGQIVRGPNTCILTFSSKRNKNSNKIVKSIYKAIQEINIDITFDQCINSIIALDSFTIFKKRPNSEVEFNNKAQYVAYFHDKEDEFHFGLQFLLTGILAAYYHESRKAEARPGFTSFPTDRPHNVELGNLSISKLR